MKGMKKVEHLIERSDNLCLIGLAFRQYIGPKHIGPKA